MLEVKIFNQDGDVAVEFAGEDSVDFVSLVSNGTYGPPALVAPSQGVRSAVGDRVLYINTAFVPLFQIERVEE